MTFCASVQCKHNCIILPNSEMGLRNNGLKIFEGILVLKMCMHLVF